METRGTGKPRSSGIALDRRLGDAFGGDAFVGEAVAGGYNGSVRSRGGFGAIAAWAVARTARKSNAPWSAMLGKAERIERRRLPADSMG